MKLAEITTKNDQELATLVTDLRAQIAAATIELRTKEVKNVKAIAGLKHTLAQALTLLREREISREEAQ